MEEHILQIPRILHYCWFGKGEKSDLVLKCIDSWKNQLPDYEIIEWNENNFDVTIIEYTKQAYHAKKYAFVSDYARLWIVYHYGGIYVDTDVEILKSLDPFLNHRCFMAFEGDHGVALGLIFGGIKGNPILYEIMEKYHKSSFLKSDNTFHMTTIIKNTTDVLVHHGLKLDSSKKQVIEDIVVYPRIVFCPGRRERRKGRYDKRTYTVHHYEASWRTKEFEKRIRNPAWRVFFGIMAHAGKIAGRLLGEKRWHKIRDVKFKKLYNLIRGQ